MFVYQTVALPISLWISSSPLKSQTLTPFLISSGWHISLNCLTCPGASDSYGAPKLMKLNLIFNLSHVNWILRPMWRVYKGRGNIFSPEHFVKLLSISTPLLFAHLALFFFIECNSTLHYIFISCIFPLTKYKFCDIRDTHSTVIYQAPTMCLLGTVLGLEDKWVYLGKCLSYTRYSMNTCWINKWMSSPKPVGAELWCYFVQFIYALLLSIASIQKTSNES